MLGRLDVLKIDTVCLRRKIKPTTERAPNWLAEYMRSIVTVQEKPASDVSGFSRFKESRNMELKWKRSDKKTLLVLFQIIVYFISLKPGHDD